MPKPSAQNKSPLMPFIVGVANDLTEYAYVRVFAKTGSEAEQIVTELLDSNSLTELEFESGDDREGPYTCDASTDNGDHSWVELTIENGRVISPKPFELKCPHCQYDGKEESSHGGTFRYLTNIPIYREIREFKRSKKGRKLQLIVEGQSDRYPEDHESDDRIECRSCLQEFNFPKNLNVAFV
jgi:hypothetical protein